MPNTLEARVAGALTNVRNARVNNDVISAGMVRELEVGTDGRVSFTFLLSRDDPAQLVREARRAVEGVDGVVDVKIAVQEPADSGSRPAGTAPARRAPAPPSQGPAELTNLGQVIAVSSGKGGVGKSTVSANLAVALAKDGLRVGIMDADVYGPNIPRMFGITEKPAVHEGKIIPLERHGVRLISLGLMVDRD